VARHADRGDDDENGGRWDHVAPPKGDLLGSGTRIPALILSPFAKKNFVDHTPYDTASVLRFIAHRYSLPVLDGLKTLTDGYRAEGPALSDGRAHPRWARDMARRQS
jgi:phospholipase C